jgi:hypothetical protein
VTNWTGATVRENHFRDDSLFNIADTLRALIEEMERQMIVERQIIARLETMKVVLEAIREKLRFRGLAITQTRETRRRQFIGALLDICTSNA